MLLLQYTLSAAKLLSSHCMHAQRLQEFHLLFGSSVCVRLSRNLLALLSDTTHLLCSTVDRPSKHTLCHAKHGGRQESDFWMGFRSTSTHTFIYIWWNARLIIPPFILLFFYPLLSSSFHASTRKSCVITWWIQYKVRVILIIPRPLNEPLPINQVLKNQPWQTPHSRRMLATRTSFSSSGSSSSGSST